ncbi:MAG: M36 family metallopeptidase, partial [Acidobacteriota bacterium]
MSTRTPGRIRAVGGTADEGSWQERGRACLEALSPLLGVDDPSCWTPAGCTRTSTGQSIAFFSQRLGEVPINRSTRQVVFARHETDRDRLGRLIEIRGDHVPDAVTRLRPEFPILDSPEDVKQLVITEMLRAEPTLENDLHQLTCTHLEKIYLSHSVDRNVELVLAWSAWVQDAPVSAIRPMEQWRVLLDARTGELIEMTSSFVTATGHVRDFSTPEQRQPRPLPVGTEMFPTAITDLVGSVPRAWVGVDSCRGDQVECFAGQSDRTFRGTLIDGELRFDPETSVDRSACRASDDDNQCRERRDAILHAFYYCNLMHHLFYNLGFDERAGNLQRRAEPGLSDPVIVEVFPEDNPILGRVQSEIDGRPSIIKLWRHPDTNRHAALDADIVFHEYTHAVTNRVVGGPAENFPFVIGSAPEPRGLSEG